MPASNQHYEIEANITAMPNSTFTYRNIHQFTVIKAPFNKLANIVTMTVESDTASLSIVANSVQVKNEPKCVIKIYALGSSGDGDRQIRSDKIFEGEFFVFHQINEELSDNGALQDNTTIMTFILADPILHWLQVNHEFISLIDNSSGNDALLKFEDYLTAKFGKDTFAFQHTSNDLNKHVYEQILIRSPNDLSIPVQLINKYKAFNSLSYYYYDDFNFASLLGNKALNHKAAGKKAAITNLSLSLGDLSSLPKIDMHDSLHKDAISRINTDNVESMADYELIFQRDSSTIFVQNPDQVSSLDIPLSKNDHRPKISKSKITNNKLIKDNAGRTVYGSENTLSRTGIKAKHHISLYSPDSAIKATNRFKSTQSLISSDIKSYVSLTIQECYPDLINLSSLYNIDIASRSVFSYLPITIANIFHKQKSKDAILTHSTKVTFMNFNI